MHSPAGVLPGRSRCSAVRSPSGMAAAQAGWSRKICFRMGRVTELHVPRDRVG